MNVLIVGGGRIGGALASELVGGGHQVVVVEKSVEVADELRARVQGLTVVHGDGDEPLALEAARISHADVVAAMADEDEDNLVACLLAKREYGVGRTIARANVTANEWLFGERFGVDDWIAAGAIDPVALANRVAGA